MSRLKKPKRKINPGLAAYNARRTAERKARERRELALKTGNVVGLETEELQMAVEQHMAAVPDDNPVKLACRTEDYDPLTELISIAKNHKTDKKLRADLNKYLVDKLVPNLRSLDVQKKTKMSVTVKVQSFRDASQKELKQLAKIEEFKDADYAEFEEIEDDE